MKEMQGKGVKLKTWSPEFLAAFEKEWNEVAAEQAAKSPEFKKAWDSLQQVPRGIRDLADTGYLK